MIEDIPVSILKDTLRRESVPRSLLNALEDPSTKSQPIGIACSGGADSVFLCQWFLTVFPEHRCHTILLHFNHKTRADASEADAQFVAHLAEKLGVKSVISAHPGDPSEIKRDEARLRRARMRFFLDTFREQNLSLLLTAHHLDDRVESLLMRLSRASALDGLVTPKAVRVFKSGLIIGRPLLGLRKQEIIATLAKIDQPFQHDASNDCHDYYRNYIRHQLLPRWDERQQGQLHANIAQSIRYLEEDAEVLNHLAEQAVQSIDLNPGEFPLAQLSHHPLAIQRRCIWRWLNMHTISAMLSHAQVDRLLHLKAGDTLSLSKEWNGTCTSAGALRLQSRRLRGSFSPKQFHMSSTKGKICFPDGNSLQSERIHIHSNLYQQITSGKDDPYTQIHIDISALGGAPVLEVKFWQDGMTYHPLGLRHNKKLKSCFIDRKIPSHQRRRLPLICNLQGEILWVPGLPPSEAGRVTTDSKRVLRLTYEKT